MAKKPVPEKFEAGYLDRLDGRTAIAADLRARWHEFTNDLGGVEQLSYGERSLVERALWLEVWLRHQERALAENRHAEFDAGKWTQAVNSLQGILVKLGLERRQKDVTDLATYLQQKAAE